MKIWRKPFDYAEKVATLGQVCINKERCKGCGYCVEFCPREVLKMSMELSAKGYLLVEVNDEANCVICGYCEAICPEFAIKVSTTE
ncbi:4Fe-4S binding protein [Chloroflexota bacterium]